MNNAMSNIKIGNVVYEVKDNFSRNRIETLNNQITSLASGSPLVATSVAEMTNTTKTYVNTTDGNWYYYNGENWVIGGTYQGTEIANNSITKIKLNNDIFTEDVISAKNILMNSTSRNSFSKYLSFAGEKQATVKVKGTFKNARIDGLGVAVFRIVTSASNDINSIGANLTIKEVNVANPETEIDIEENIDLSNYKYGFVHMVFLTGGYTDIGDIEIEKPLITINGELINIIDMRNNGNDVATYDYEFIMTGKEAVAKKSDLANITKSETVINNINVSTAEELVNNLKSIATSKLDNIANEKNIYNIYLSEGTYELYPYIDKTNLADQSVFNRGIEIPDYVNLIGIGDVTISCTIPEADNTADLNLTRIISTINTYGENTFKNINFIADNCRYCVHDDGGGAQKNRTIKFDNCTFEHKGVEDSLKWPSPECYGAGYTAGRKGIFKNCIFKSVFIPFYVHNSTDYYMTDKCYVEIENCVFDTTHNTSIDIHDAYASKYTGNVSINNSKLSTKLLIRGTTKWNIFGGGNNDFEVENQTESNNYLV